MTVRSFLLAAFVTLVPTTAFAQLDDLLAPLAPEKEAPKKKKRTKKRSVKKQRDRAADKQDASGNSDLLAPLVPTRGELIVKIPGVEGATVTVNKKQVSPGAKVELDAGEHLVLVTRPGYADYSKKVKITGGQTTEISAPLDAVAGVLTVTSDVPGSDVLVDGKSVGAAPVRGALVEPGMREVVVRKEGFEDHVSSLSVRAGRDYTIPATLQPSDSTRTIVASNADRPENTRLVPDMATSTDVGGLTTTEESVEQPEWYQRWYVWAGAGAVAVAAVSSAVVVNNNANRRLSPEEVCDVDPNDGQPGSCDYVMNLPSAILQLGGQIRF